MPLKDPDARRAYASAYRAANREKIRAQGRIYLAANRERVYATNRAYRIANPEKMKEAIHKWGQENPARLAYLHQRVQATRRGIPFLLTFEEWWDIWQASGKWEQRGIRKGQYVMARYGDTGPYAVGNVRICTGQENNSEQARHSLRP